MSLSLRTQVLRLYSRILRVGRKWESVIPNQTSVERDFIISEAKTLFRVNKNIKGESEIAERIKEGEARLVMAEHYRNPYPRPANIPKRSFSKREGKKLGKAFQKFNEQSRPVYLRSIDNIKEEKSDGKT